MFVISCALIAVFALLAVSHLIMAYQRYVRRRSVSAVPLICGLIGCLGFYLSPDPSVARLWWLPFLLDWGCVPLLTECAVFWFLWKYTRFGR